MNVRFSNLWMGIAIWIFLDLLMIRFGQDIPTWLAFDGRDALRRDIWVVFFVGWMWLCYREPALSPSEGAKTP